MASRRSKPAARRARGKAPPPLPPALAAIVENAVSRHRAGDPAAAEPMYREVLRQAPGHPDTHHLLGLALHQQGRNADARREIEAAIAAFADAPHYHNNLGEVLRSEGDLDGAVRCYRRALELAPGDLQASNNLGLALHAAGRLADARDVFARLVQAAPRAPEAHNNLGVAEQALGNLDAAVKSFRATVELSGEHAEGWNNLGAALHASGDPAAARDALQRAVDLAPGSARAHYNLSRVHAAQGAWEDAEASVRRAIGLEPREAEFHLHLGYVLRARDRFDESVAAVRAALACAPGHPLANNDLGVALLVQGDFQDAERHLRAAVDAAPGLAVAYENLARTRRFDDGDAALMERISKLLLEPGMDDAARAHLHFALGKMWEDRGEPARAFSHLEAANALVHAALPWDAAARSRHVDRLIEVFGRDWFARRAEEGAGHPSSAPVFVVGMLRSGTTLVEQILASHPKVLACGEIEFFDGVAAMMPQRLGVPDLPYPACAPRLTAEDLGALARRYLAQVFAEPGGAERFTDKNPLNVDHLGLIAVLFPHAHIVHVRRDPMDTCASIFATHFSRDLPFAYDLDDIGRYYRDYRRLMAHWEGCLGPRIHEVRYEALVAQQEDTTRALLAACGLDFDPACLAFHETRRAVGTASHWQVRQPLYGNARGRAQRFGDGLAALRAALDG